MLHTHYEKAISLSLTHLNTQKYLNYYQTTFAKDSSFILAHTMDQSCPIKATCGIVRDAPISAGLQTYLNLTTGSLLSLINIPGHPYILNIFRQVRIIPLSHNLLNGERIFIYSCFQSALKFEPWNIVRYQV